MVYSLKQLSEYVKPVAEKYNIPAVYVFGSYARGEATEQSDLDLLVELKDSSVHGWILGGLFNDFEEALPVAFDIMTIGTLRSSLLNKRLPQMTKNIEKDMVKIYERPEQ